MLTGFLDLDLAGRIFQRPFPEKAHGRGAPGRAKNFNVKWTEVVPREPDDKGCR